MTERMSLKPQAKNARERPRGPGTIAFLVTEDWFFCSHFIGRAIAAKRAGYDVAVLTRVGQHGERITQAGLNLVPIRLSRQSRNPLREVAAILELRRLYRRLRPTIVHQYAVKPILYGTIAAQLARVPRILNAPVGMGFVYGSRRGLARLLRPFVALAFRALLNPSNGAVVFENPDDMAAMIANGSTHRERTYLIRGAGVDTTQFRYTPEPMSQPIRIVLVSRMLVEKGIPEFVAAARAVRSHGLNAQFVLVGEGDTENPNCVPQAQLQAWNDEGIVDWLGRRDDVSDILAGSHIACLPSYYREGLPKTLLEAAAAGRPIVTTDTPGCREAVHHEVNGLLVPPRNHIALVNALERLIVDQNLRERLGRRGRERALSEFSLEHVDERTLAVYTRLSHLA